jgi:hypothetical protein
MDEKIIKLNINKTNEKTTNFPEKKKQSIFHSNPILQKMFLTNMNNKKGKFSLKDLFR